MTGIETPAKAGKKCGCRCGAESGSCRCGTPSVGCVVTTGYELARPVFFAGQLLAESDMDAVSTYLQTKLRLHNRYLFGAGVACGLIVTPATDAEVCVGSGYALDGCGNDVIVPVAQTVSVIELVRELRRGVRIGACDTPLPGAKGLDGEYDLFVRGHDTPAEFDSPYETTEGCNPQCHPTRMREDFAFELRHASGCEPEGPPCGTNPDLAGAVKKLRSAATVIDAARAVLTRHKSVSDAVKKKTEAELRTTADEAIAAVVSAEKAGPSKSREARKAYLSAALTALPRIARYRVVAKAGDWKALWPDTASKSFEAVRNLCHTGGRLDPAVVLRWVELLNAQAEQKTFDSQALLVGEPIVRAKLTLAVQSVQEAARELQIFGDLQLVYFPPDVVKKLAELAKADVPGDPPGSAELEHVATHTRAVADVVERAGSCLPLLPPCCPPDDPAVRIATITITEGKVTNVCNLSRTVLFTPANLLYWRRHCVRPFVPCERRRCPELKESLRDYADASKAAFLRWEAGNPDTLAQVISTAVKARRFAEPAEAATPFEIAARALEVRRRMIEADLEARWATRAPDLIADKPKEEFLRAIFKNRLSEAGVAKLVTNLTTEIDVLGTEDLNDAAGGGTWASEPRRIAPLAAETSADIAALATEDSRSADALKTAWLSAAVLAWANAKRAEISDPLRRPFPMLLSSAP